MCVMPSMRFCAVVYGTIDRVVLVRPHGRLTLAGQHADDAKRLFRMRMTAPVGSVPGPNS
jgi:hypothetical protein